MWLVFVWFISGIDEKEKDAFFKHYPNCLAQSLYQAFYVAFPRSRKLFNRKFKEELVSTIYEWCTGNDISKQIGKSQ